MFFSFYYNEEDCSGFNINKTVYINLAYDPLTILLTLHHEVLENVIINTGVRPAEAHDLAVIIQETDEFLQSLEDFLLGGGKNK